MDYTLSTFKAKLEENLKIFSIDKFLVGSKNFL